MTAFPRASAPRIASTLLAYLAGILGFLAFNVIDGVFGLAPAIVGLGAYVATTVFVFRRSPREKKDTDS